MKTVENFQITLFCLSQLYINCVLGLLLHYYLNFKAEKAPSNPDKILDGEIDEFLEESIYQTK